MRLLLYELLLIKDGFATDLLINRLLMLILSFYLLFYDFFNTYFWGGEGGSLAISD